MSPASASAPASSTPSCRSRWSPSPTSECRCSRSPTRCLHRDHGGGAFSRLVTSSTTCSRAGSPSTSGSSAWCWRGRPGGDRARDRLGCGRQLGRVRRPRRGARRRRRRLAADVIGAIRDEVQARGAAAAPFVPPQPDLRGAPWPTLCPPRGAAEARLVVVAFGRARRLRAALRAAGGDRGRAGADAGAGRRETERRLSGEVLTAILSGRLDPDDLRDSLAPFGVGEGGGAGLRARRPAAGRGPRGVLSSADLRPWSPRVATGAWSCSARWSIPARATRRGRRRGPRALERAHGPLVAAASRSLSAAGPDLLPRGPLRAEANGVRQRRRPRGRVSPRPGRLHAAALPSRTGRRCGSTATASGPIEELGRALRRRASALARGLHRAQRQLGAGRRQLLLPPSHAALPDRKIEDLTGRDLRGPTDGSRSGWRSARGS